MNLLDGLNAEQIAAVQLENNGVCSAGAGAGKTFVLTRRYLSLLTRDKNPLGVQDILTLTFTQKAAQEMYSRIYKSLGENRKFHPQIDRAFKDFDRSSITTLDAFCRQVAAQGSPRYGIPTSFTIDNRLLDSLIDKEIREFIHRNYSNPLFQDFTSAFGLKSVWEQVLVPIAKNLAVPVPRVASLVQSWAEDEALVQKIFQESITRLLTLSANLAEYLEARHEEKIAEAKNPKSAGLAEGEQKAYQHMKEISQMDPEDLSRNFLSTDFLPGKIERRPAAKKSEVLDDGFVTQWNQLKEIWEQSLPANGSFLRYTDQGRALAVLLEEFRQQIIRSKRRTGIVTFTDISMTAIQVLLDDGDLADYYRRRFQGIMIDEFQDNNFQQKTLLYLLAARVGYNKPEIPGAEDLRPGVLFFVGDQKQSIYQFRGADVRVFKDLSRELSQKSLNVTTEVRLSTNYRSSPGLIRYFNTLFEKIFSLDDDYPDEFRHFEADFTPIHFREQQAGEEPPIIEFWIQPLLPSKNPRSLSVKEAECRSLAKRIREILDQGVGVWDREENRMRPVQQRDIAVLLRTGANQMTLEKMLRLYGIGYQVQSNRSLFLDALASDFTAFFAVLLYPDDQISWVGLARSPFLNLSNTGLAEIADWSSAHGQSWEWGNPDLSEEDKSLQNPQFSLESDRGKWMAFQKLYVEVYHLIDRENPGYLADVLWIRGGYQSFVLANRSARGFFDQYEYLRAYLEGFSGQPLTTALQGLRENLGKYEKIDEVDVIQPRRDGVHIMTIHGSKGLEFPVVFLADLGGGSNSKNGKNAPGLSTSDDQGMPKYVVNPVFDQNGTGENVLVSAEQEKNQFAQWAELKRLFYVGCTRAEHHLFFYGSYTRNNQSGLFLSSSGDSSSRNPGPVRDKSFLSLFMKRYIDEFDSELRADEEKDMGRLFKSRSGFSDGLKLRTIEVPDTQDWLAEYQALTRASRMDTDSGISSPIPPWEPVPLIQNPSGFSKAASDQIMNEEWEAVGDGDQQRPLVLGSLTHWILERSIRLNSQGKTWSATLQVPPSTPPPADHQFWFSLPGQLERTLDRRDDRTSLITEAWKLSQNFFQTTLAGELKAAGNGKAAGELETTDALRVAGEKSVAGELKAAGEQRTAGGFRLYPEVPLVLYHQDRWLRGTIDLVVEFPQTRERWVIDYKTDHHLDPSVYEEQLEWYRIAARTAFLSAYENSPENGEWKVECYLVGLRTGEVHHL